MVQYWLRTFPTGQSHCKELTALVQSHMSSLASDGYVARRDWFVAHSAGCAIRCGATMCGPDVPEAVRADVRYAPVLGKIEPLLQGTIESEVLGLAAGEDDDYCPHESWDHIVIQGDPLLGVSALRHKSCAGLIGRYRIRGTPELAEAMWSWDAQHEYIYSCWLASGCYEAWAGQQLSDPESPLNRLGTDVARRLRQELGCEVMYEPETLDS